MIPLILRAQVVAKAVGLPAVMIVALLAVVLIASMKDDTVVRIAALCPITIVLLAAAWRMLRGTDHGSTDIAMTREGFFASNIPLADFGGALKQMLSAYRRQPLPQPIGVVEGSAADTASLHERRIALPPHVETATAEPRLSESAGHVE